MSKQTNKTLKRKSYRHAMIVERVPPPLRQEFRILCLRKGTTMRAVIVEAIEAYVRKHK